MWSLPRAQKFVLSGPNIDKIVEDMLRQPWTYSQVFVQLAHDKNPALDDLVDVHTFNRLLVTFAPDMVQTYTTHQCINKHRSAPSRDSVLATLREWFQKSDSIDIDISTSYAHSRFSSCCCW